MSQQVKLDVVFAVDDAYVEQLKVVIFSLVCHNSPDNVRCYVVHHAGALSPGSIAGILEHASLYSLNLQFCEFNSEDLCLAHLLDDDHVSLATYYRLFLSTALPESVNRCLYLDADIIVTGSLLELATCSLEYPIAAVDHCGPGPYLVSGDYPTSYFNAGVLLVDIERWRAHSVEHSLVNCLAMNNHRITWWDQDVLNIYFRDSWDSLPIWYNLTGPAFAYVPHEMVCDKAKIIHFDGSSKPWHANCRHPFKDLWLEAYSKCFGHQLSFATPVESISEKYVLRIRAIARSAAQHLGLMR